eukprot:CAMPEP_0118664978 /NCGR_PEP_ID=MMETSP0785-20121206/18353_1 /TAXON_ID=91992 /ORGANISM="Bolidomonas pacifica, Strain CCMP 1866" /LENGTH=193 /DNA_ID=CAMNT_0006559025 /DNA_START=200 /DNA_END=777 /DNA_ORIENTATION=+
MPGTAKYRTSGNVRDPSAPKLPRSAYLLFSHSSRNAILASSPGLDFGGLSKETSRIWKAMSDNERGGWKRKEEEDKKRYENEIAKYKPPEGYNKNGEKLKAWASGVKRTRDPLAPKKPLTSFILYQHANRAEFKEANPTYTFGELASYTSKMFKELGSEEKKLWEDKATKDKARYEREMKEYKPKKGKYDEQG